MFIRFYFVYMFQKIIEYIESLYDDQSLASQRANELFLLLEERDELELSDSIQKCSQLMFDLLIHFLDEYIDPNWLSQKENLSDKLSRQKEVEKQNLINELEGKTAEERLATVNLQNAGITNWFVDQSVANLARIKTSKYEEQLETERLEKVRESLLLNQTELEVAENFGVNVDHLLNRREENEKDDFYSQKDEDREDEGLDDADQDGDYKEN